MSEGVLGVEDVSFQYSSSGWRLEHISLELGCGQIVGFIGPNGAGKSTFLKIAAGLLKSKEGQVSLMGKDISRLGRRSIARQLGYLPQNVSSTFDYRVEEIVAMGRFCHLSGACFLEPEDIRIVNRCMEDTETLPFRDRPLSQLSGGQRQRVLLASVLAQRPRVLLLDEPTTGLDLYHQTAFFGLLRKLAKEGIAIALVTHDLNLASMFCDRILLLWEGRTVREGAVEEVVTEEVLSPVYRNGIQVIRQKEGSRPIILPAALRRGEQTGTSKNTTIAQ